MVGQTVFAVCLFAMTDSRRRLPHWVPDQVPVFVTWRLAATLPRQQPAVLHADDSPGRRFVLQDEALHQGSGARWLKDARVAKIVVEALRHGAEDRRFYRLDAFVVMPNHVHVVWEPFEPMSEILKWLKRTTAYRAKAILNLDGGQFWQRESWAHWIRSGAELRKVVRYVEENPVKAGLVGKAEERRWSSANADNKIVCATSAFRFW